MSRTLTTFLTSAALVAGAAAYEANADLDAGDPAVLTTTQPARTQTYIPRKIGQSEVEQGTRSSKEYTIRAEPVEINGTTFEVYANEFAEGDELGFMLVVPNEGVENYQFGTTPDATTAFDMPRTFYIPTRVNAINDAGETVPARTFTLAEKVQAGIPFTLKTFSHGGTEFFQPNARAEVDGTQSFYFLPIIGDEENVTRDRTTGEITVTTENGNGIFEQGEGVFRPKAITYGTYLARKVASDAEDAQRKLDAEAKAKRDAEAVEQKRLEDLKAPKPGTEGSIGA